jgi:hypothetical protein
MLNLGNKPLSVKKNSVGHVLAINMASVLKLERPMPIELVAKSI